MNGLISADIIQNDVQLMLPGPLKMSQSTSGTQTLSLQHPEENLENATEVDSESTNLNAITSSIYLPNVPNSKIQVLEENFLNNFNNQNQKLVVNDTTTSINDQIEIVSAHKCKLCGQLFERYDTIISHIQNAHQAHTKLKKDEETKNLYLCGKCDEKSVAYENIEQLKLHMIVSHNLVDKESEQSENTTDGELLNDELLKKMVHNHETADKKVKCMIKGCDNSFVSKETMLKHMEYHTEGMKKRFKCLKCDKLFFIWRTCRAHIWKAHKIDVGLYECSMCKSFKCLAPYDLLVHMKIHSNPKNFKPFLCSTCGEQFNRMAELQNHSNSHVKAKAWDVNCRICDKSFANFKYLKRHIQSVHDQYKPFVCNICGHKCARKSMLDLHLRQHTGEKPYKCELCDFKTGDHNSFRRHGLRHSGLSNYSCQYCKYVTIQSNAYKLHMKKKHPGKGGFFSCATCPFNSVNEKLYQQHVEKHKREKPSSPPSEEIAILDKTKDSTVPNLEDEETQIGLFADHLEDTVDTGGITIPAVETNST
ncbi:zinc finger protein 454-like [Atheta coriaria]|uniref:zinc finger protein 454-like n=1 Tax=Dalotia coriaria TaxID=877792 RepID=UPI0031F361A0